jgi:hypothetical protein
MSLRGDPLLEGSGPPGWFFGLELGLVVPHITNGLNALVTVPGFQPDIVAIGGAPLDWTGSPKFDLGYRFGEGLGEAVLSYRLLATDGRAILPGWDLDGSDAPLKTDLQMNVVDLDYVSRDIVLGGIGDLHWRAGLRLASVHFDSRAEGFFLEQQASNNFFGAGPRVGLDLGRRLGNTQFGLYGRIDASVPIGRVHQSFNESFITQDGNIVGAATDVNETQAVPTLGIQLGLSWTPGWRGCVSRYSFGYEFEEWWSVGEAGTSHADLFSQGLFFRGEFNF